MGYLFEKVGSGKKMAACSYSVFLTTFLVAVCFVTVLLTVSTFVFEVSLAFEVSTFTEVSLLLLVVLEESTFVFEVSLAESAELPEL